MENEYEQEREKIRRNLLERYLSTGKVGLIKPSNTDEAIDLIETVVDIYIDVPKSNKGTTYNNEDNENDVNDNDSLFLINEEDIEEDNIENETAQETMTLSQMSEKLKNLLADI